MNRLREFFRLVALGLQSCRHRPRHGILVAAGLSIASLALLAVLIVPAGLSRIAGQTGREDIAVILASPHWDETDGAIDPELARRIGALPGVAHDASNGPRIAPQYVMHTKVRRHDGAMATVLVRGVTPAIWDVVDDSVRIARGQRIAAGVNELMPGAAAARQYLYAQTGSQINLALSTWRVSGEFNAGGGLWESEFWSDRDALQAAGNAQGQITTIWVRLTSPAAFAAFSDALRADPRLRHFPVLTQHDFYARRVALLALFVQMVASVIALVLGLEAILASHNAIGLSLRARRRELAVLRALGFRTGTLFAALLAEIALIAFACSAIAIGIGIVVLDGRGIDSSTFDTSIHFTTALTPHVAASVLCYALLLALASAAIPAWRALRSSLVPTLAGE